MHEDGTHAVANIYNVNLVSFVSQMNIILHVELMCIDL